MIMHGHTYTYKHQAYLNPGVMTLDLIIPNPPIRVEIRDYME